MSEENLNGAAASSEAAGPTFTVEKIYVKDVSFEVPGAPAGVQRAGPAQLQMNLNQRVQRLNDNAFEVVLGITLTCNVGGKTAYLAEVQQAGVFGSPGSRTPASMPCSARSARTCCIRMPRQLSAT